MDVLSDVLRAVKLDGAMFYDAEFSSPWSFRSPASRNMSPYLQSRPGHVIIYHLLTEGRARARLEDGESISLEAGDVVIFPHGDAHILENGTGAETVDYGKELLRIFSQGLKAAYHGGGGEVTRFVCGYMVCEPRLSSVLLGGLPPLFKVSVRDGEGGRWLENSIRFSVSEASASRPGSEAVLSKLSEVLFVETLRRFIARLPEDQRGWLAGLRDPEVAKALALLHRQPARSWTLADLAKEVGTSRSVVAERFRRYLGQPPMAYLTKWRLQLSAQMLTSTSRSVTQVASEVGYESEAAFNRAFKRNFGLPPARFRTRSKAQSAKSQISQKERAAGGNVRASGFAQDKN